MNDERMQSLLDTWYRDREVPRPRVQTSVAKVMANVPQVRQRGSWWPLPAFDRPRSTFPSRELAPAPIPATNGRQPARGFTMFSALKFIAAGVIVALFGSFLLTGVFTVPQSDEVPPAAVTDSPAPEATSEVVEAPTVRTDLLPGVELTVEEVEPGVYRVVNDGIRDLATANDFDIVAGHDGGIWLLRPRWFFRLGTPGAHDWPTETPKHAEFEVTPDGSVWVQAEGALQSFDGEGWTTHFEDGGYGTLEVTSDGTVWATWDDPETYRQVFGYLDDDGWHAFGDGGGDLYVASPDDIWGTAGGGIGPGYVVRFIDGAWQRLLDAEGTEAAWQRVGYPVTGDSGWLGLVGLGPDGTAWFSGTEIGDDDDVHHDLLRFDDSGWNRWSTGTESYDLAEVATDSSVWFTQDACDGVGHFDGETWDRHLSGLCVRAIDINAGGAAWVLAKEPGADLRHVYVITPEAVAGTE